MAATLPLQGLELNLRLHSSEHVLVTQEHSGIDESIYSQILDNFVFDYCTKLAIDYFGKFMVNRCHDEKLEITCVTTRGVATSIMTNYAWV